MGMMPMPPGAPPTGMPPGMPPGIGGPPAPPAMPPLEPDPLVMFLGQIEAMIDREGVDAVRDQLSALPPDVLDELYSLIDSDPRVAIVLGDVLDPPEREPQYDSWYEEDRKPTATEISDAAYLDEGIWREVADRIRDDIDFYHGERPTTFRSFNGKKEDAWISTKVRADSDAKIAKIATAPIKFDVPFTEQELEDPTQKAENFLYYILQCWKSQYAQVSGGRDVRHDLEWYREVTGWVFYECAVDTRGGKPFVHRLYDPTSCVPTWDEYGLARMTRLYSDTVASVISAYGSYDKKLKGKILKQQHSDANGNLRTLDYTDMVTVIYYIDRTYRAVYVNDIEVLHVKHGYGVCPVVVGGSGLSEPTDMTATGSLSAPDLLTGSQALRLYYKNTSGFHHLRRMNGQYEAVMTKFFNITARMDRPDYIIAQDEYAEGEGTPQVKSGGGEVTPIKKGHEELEALEVISNTGVLEPLIGAFANEDLTSRLPLAQHGVSQSSQQSGNATEGYIESGQDKFIIQMQSAEMMWGQIASLWLRLWRDFGHNVPNEKGQYGRAVVPYSSKAKRRHPGSPPAFEITPEMLDHIGVEAEAKLTSLRLQNLGPLGNATAIWLNNRTMSLREAMELRGVRDPDEVFEEMDYEEVLLDPDVRKIKTLQALRKRDPSTAALYEQKMFAAPGGGSGGPTDAMAAGGPMAPNSSAVSLPALGMAPDGPTGRAPQQDPMGIGTAPAPMGAGGMSY